MNAIRTRITDYFNFPPDPLRKQRVKKALFDAALTISCIALLAIYSPPFRLGMAIQVPVFVIRDILFRTFIKMPQPNREEAISAKKASVELFYDKHSHFSCVYMPVEEEFIYRGVILHASQFVMNRALPSITFKISSFPPIAVASAISVIFSSVIFGLAHHSNKYSHYKTLHVINALAAGILYSILTLNYGIMSAIGGHVLNNTLVLSLVKYPIVIAGPEKYINNRIY